MSDVDRKHAAALRVRVLDHRVVAEVPERFDFSNSDAIGEILLRAAGNLGDGAELVVDFSGTTAVDADSARTLADLERRTRALGIRLRLVVPEANAVVRDLISGDRLPGDAPVHDSRRAAFRDAVDAVDAGVRGR